MLRFREWQERRLDFWAGRLEMVWPPIGSDDEEMQHSANRQVAVDLASGLRIVAPTGTVGQTQKL